MESDTWRPQRSPDAAWTSGMLIQIARDLELIKARLGIITDAEGDTRYVPSSLLPREEEPARGTPLDSESAAAIAQLVGGPPPGVPRSDFERGFDPNCEQCDADTHLCPGCGAPLRHGEFACTDCQDAYPAGRSPEDDWLTG